MRRRRVLLNPNSRQCQSFGKQLRFSKRRRTDRVSTRFKPLPIVRTNWLKINGFGDYETYLKSQKWAEVRELAFKAKGRRCVCCWQAATQVHHSLYSDATFAGEDLKHLHPICSVCHDAIHDHRSLSAANRAMWQLREYHKKIREKSWNQS